MMNCSFLHLPAFSRLFMKFRDCSHFMNRWMQINFIVYSGVNTDHKIYFRPCFSKEQDLVQSASGAIWFGLWVWPGISIKTKNKALCFPHSLLWGNKKGYCLPYFWQNWMKFDSILAPLEWTTSAKLKIGSGFLILDMLKILFFYLAKRNCPWRYICRHGSLIWGNKFGQISEG